MVSDSNSSRICLSVNACVAEDVDFLDLGGLAFADLDVDGDAVAVQPGHVRIDRDVVLAAVVVLA